MKKFNNSILLGLLIFTAISFSNCTFRLVDFTVISSKNVNLGVDRSQGVKTEGSKSYFLGFGWNIKDAMDVALEKAGKEYDLLIDGVVRYSSFPFVLVVKVEGTAVSSSKLKETMGDAGYEEWLKTKNVSLIKEEVGDTD